MRSQFDKNRGEEHLSESELKAYLAGNMDAKDMYRVEYGLEENAFEAAAMEGYEKQLGAQEDLDALKQEFRNKIGNRSYPFFSAHRKQLSAAAMVIVLLSSIALFYYLQTNKNPIDEIAVFDQEYNEVPISYKEEISPLIKTPPEPIQQREAKEAQTPALNHPQATKKTDGVSQKKAEEKIVVEEVLEDEKTDNSLAANSTLAAANSDVSVEVSDETATTEMDITSAPADDNEKLNTPASVPATTVAAPKSRAKAPARNPMNESMLDLDASNSTKVTYIFDLKVIDYTEVYENEAIHRKVVFKPGVDPKYANRREQFIRQAHEDPLLDSITYIDALKESLAYFKAGAYERSFHNFKIIQRKHPEELNVKFYGGLIHFDKGNYKKALSDFEFVIEHPISVFDPEGEWYKAQTLVHLDRNKEARELLLKIVHEQGFYAEEATLLLQNLTH